MNCIVMAGVAAPSPLSPTLSPSEGERVGGRERTMAGDKNFSVVVLGGGFGGLTFCQRFRHPSARVTVVDRTNHYLFQPLLYQVATAGLSAPEIAQPIRAILADRPNVTVLFDEVTDFDVEKRRVFLRTKALEYAY